MQNSISKPSAAQGRVLQEKDTYEPIEFFLSSIEDHELVCWLNEQTNILRAVFKVVEYQEPRVKEIIRIGSAQFRVIRNDFLDFNVSTDEAVNCTEYNGRAICNYLKDGTVVIFMLRGDNLVGYHFCFEDAPESTFQQLITRRS